MKRTRPRIFRLTVAIVAVVIGLLLAEAVVRIAGLAPAVYRLRPGEEKSAYRLSDNPVLGYVLKESYRDDDLPDLQDSFPRTNAHGQRDIERSFARSGGRKRILLLGDSVVAGHGIRDLDDTISRQLERGWASDGVEVLNFGVGGYCTAAEVELLAERGLRYSPDLVIVLFTGNDYRDRNEQLVSVPFERPRWAESLFVHSHLFRYVALVTDIYRFREATDPGVHLREHESALGDQNVSRGLKRLLSLSEKHGFRAMVAVWPAFTSKGVVDRHTIVGRPDRLMVELIAEEIGIPCHRLSPTFLEDHLEWIRTDPAGRREGPASATERYTIGDGMHPSVLGAAVGARALRSILENHPDLLESD